MRRKIVSFLVSGRGLNYKVVVKRIIKKQINACLGIVISDRKEAGVFDLAEGFGMRSFYINPEVYSDRTEFDREMIKLFKKYKTDLIVAAGYMRILSPAFVNEYRNRIINIHPSLLPSFPGTKSQQKAIDYGVKVTGCTAHFIDEGIDTGPIILQSSIVISENDNLDSVSRKILYEEFKILPDAVKMFCENRISVSGRRVKINNKKNLLDIFNI